MYKLMGLNINFQLGIPTKLASGIIWAGIKPWYIAGDAKIADRW